MMKLPKARTENLLEQNLKDETLIYDLVTDKAFNLNETLSAVYKACGRNQTFDDLKRESKFTDDFIFLALDELKRNNLLAESFDSPFANTSRRDVIKKVGLATMFALPIITGLVAPKAAHAASGANDGDDGINRGVGSGCRFEGDYCQPGLGCTMVSTVGSYACCSYSVGARGNIILPGRSLISDETAPLYELREPGAPSYEPEACREFAYCCDGSIVSGGCTYTPAGESTDGRVFSTKYCNCYCS